jgi:hypothetical protein
MLTAIAPNAVTPIPLMLTNLVTGSGLLACQPDPNGRLFYAISGM